MVRGDLSWQVLIATSLATRQRLSHMVQEIDLNAPESAGDAASARTSSECVRREGSRGS